MATLQDFLDLDGVRLDRNTVIVSTPEGDQIVADVLNGAELRYTDYGSTMAAELDSAPTPAATRRRKKVDPFPELPVPDPTDPA